MSTKRLEFANNQGFRTYVNFKKILKLLDEGERTSLDILKNTDVCRTTIHRMLNALLKNNVIVASDFKHIYTKNGTLKRIRVFKINPEYLVESAEN